MRQVFTSPRLENVEAVAALLRDAGIEVKITEPRSYRGNRRRSFTYRTNEESPPQPAVWIVRADDQPRGRQLLREAGLLDSSRAGESSYLPLSLLQRDEDAQADGKRRRAMRIKLGLLAAILLVVGLMVFGVRRGEVPPAPARAAASPAPAAPPVVPEAVEELTVYRADVPTALAQLVLGGAVGSAPRVCIVVDGRDPSAAVIDVLRRDAGKAAVFPGSACPAGTARRIEVADYMTDGSGRGTVRLTVDAGAARVLEVERDGERWRVTRTR